MKNAFFIKKGDSLFPADSEAYEKLKELKEGAVYSVQIKQERNPRFHRKMFALLRLAFDAWEPEEAPEYKGQKIQKDFERFRKDILILAGFYQPVYNARSEVRLEASSLSLSKMSKERFDEVFRGVLSVVWVMVLSDSGYYRDKIEVENVVNRLIGFE